MGIEKKNSFGFPGAENKKEGSELLSPELWFIKEQAEKISSKLIEIRRTIHENPELGFQEFNTARLVEQKLKDLGLEVESGIAGTGVTGYLRGTEPGKLVAIRADMDALPISGQEKSGDDFASTKEGVMHSCGHDAHTAAVLGTAEILKNLKDQNGQKGDVLFIFQPNEERAVEKRSGAVAMIKYLSKRGAWEKVDAVLAFHTIASLPLGTVRLKNGLMLAGSSRFDLKVTGPGGHGARVHEVPNPVIMGSKIVAGIADKFGHTKPSKTPNEVVVNPTFITGDTQSYNVIGKEEKIGGTIRVLSEQDVAKIRQGIVESIKEIANEAVNPWSERGANYEFGFNPGTRPGVHRDSSLVKLAEDVCKDVIGSEAQFNRDVSPAGDDFTFYLEKFRGKQIPGIYFFLGSANPEKGIPACQHHQPNFRIDESVIPQASAILAEMSRKIQQEK